jgi:hypothetical protein
MGPRAGRNVANAIKFNSERLSLRSGVIPYLGLPAYPVNTNSDKLLIGIRNDERFLSVRSVCHPELMTTIAAKLAHHFSCVRKTHTELLKKFAILGIMMKKLRF